MTKNAITVTLVLILAAACGGGESSYFAVDADYRLRIKMTAKQAEDPCFEPGTEITVDQELFLREAPPGNEYTHLELSFQDEAFKGEAWEAGDPIRPDDGGEPAEHPGAIVFYDDPFEEEPFVGYLTEGPPRGDIWDATAEAFRFNDSDACYQEGVGVFELQRL